MSNDPVVSISAAASSKGEGGGKPRPKGLGRGLGALMGDTKREEPVATQAARKVATQETVSSGLATLAVADIAAHPDQPRTRFDEDSLKELSASIAQRGVIQPVIVRPTGKGKYQLVAGERRWRAAQLARIHEIPAIVRDLEDRDVMALALIENLQREDLNPIEEARAYQRLADHEDLTQAEIAEMVDKSRSHVANLQRLLSLPEPVIELVEAGDLSMGHARALIGSNDAVSLARDAVAKGLSVRDIERLTRRSGEGDGRKRKSEKGGSSSANADIAAVEAHLEEIIGMPVRIHAGKDAKSGEVRIRYANLDQLDMVCQKLTGGPI